VSHPQLREGDRKRVPLLLQNRSLYHPAKPNDHRPRVRVRVAGLYNDRFDDKPEVEAIIDTGFAGWIILPSTMKGDLSRDYLAPLAPQQCPRLRRFGEKKGIPHLDTFTLLRVRVLGDEGLYSEVVPDYVCFAEIDHGLIGVDFLLNTKSRLFLDGNAHCFTLDMP